MQRDSVASVTTDARAATARPLEPEYDYEYLPGEEQNPIMESTLHAQWSTILVESARHTLAGTDALVTNNVPFVLDDINVHTAADLMVIPGAAGRQFTRYVPGVDGPPPTVCVEVLSKSNSRSQIERRCTRWLRAGVAEVYVIDPYRESVVRIELIDDRYVETSALGVRSPGLALTFIEAGGHLALCCPAGKVVRPGDDPFGWLVEEQERSFAARVALAEAEAQRDAVTAERDELLARLRELDQRAPEA
jgi:hypothetical protein